MFYQFMQWWMMKEALISQGVGYGQTPHGLPWVCQSDHDLLMCIRNGKYSTQDGQMNDDFFHLVNLEEVRFDKAKEHSVLSDKPDYEAIDKLHS